MSDVCERANRFFALLNGKRPLVLPSAWDAGSAQLLARAGALAIAIQFDDVAWSLGYATWTNAPDEVVAACARICRAVLDLPVTVSLGSMSASDGFGGSCDPPHLFSALIAAGIAGVTASADAKVDGGIRCIRLLRSLALHARTRLFVEARLDPHLIEAEVGGRSRRGEYEEMLRLSQACAAAGADGVLLSARSASAAVRLVRDVSMPVSIDVGDGWAAPVQMFASAGVRCVRLGGGPLRAVLKLLTRVVVEAQERGSYDLMSRYISETVTASRPA
jgi:2-methylisocitrate lyase-like PEP mutase family enzyme